MLPSRSRLPLAVAAALVLPGCTTWARQSAPPAQVVASHPDALIRVTRTDHSVITVRGATVLGDTLIGTTDDDARLRVAIPVADVEAVDTRAVSGARTAGLGAGVFLGVLAVAGIAATIALLSLNNY